jgi:hypothetical protein
MRRRTEKQKLKRNCTLPRRDTSEYSVDTEVVLRTSYVRRFGDEYGSGFGGRRRKLIPQA